MLQLRDVVKSYDGKSTVTALAGITLSIAPGEMVAIMGPSGSGKSTLLNLMGGLDVPTSGQLLVAGKDLARESEKARSLFRRNSVSYIFQAYHLMPTLRVRQNVALPLQLAGVSAKKAALQVERVLAEVGLEKRGDHLPDELSGGERQRVAIARALATDAPLLLADEPTGNLDSARGREILALLRSIHANRNTTIVMVTHDHDAASVCDRLIRLRDGRVEDDGVVIGGGR
ncbi:lipoprotein release ABC transporter, ATP-binding protein [Citrifermentans bemidjiense Bem]|uniref:Lipoprotein release ABC transporter, ATP-binding protein n=1 Tax=Citrifermentans bemidjiense (strain ATCC BAA-1014 / DSM 16622 / JCM 12645 / Bem) TaxID=404380 RepID=B5EBJ7_CITBB|nr:ABC transporter ATP-binding protein [Citrifermentans bemidjiense]ACH37466.1 lipoprotein release ABC transporter, ATP-binding protein [Citrifermentans bemidjiense Bem]